MQKFTLDIMRKSVVPLLYAKQRDKGTKILVEITNNGEPYQIPDNAAFSVWYSGQSGNGNYTTIDDESAFSIDGNTAIVELAIEMLANSGSHEMCLVMNVSGDQVGLWNIPYYVENIPGASKRTAMDYYTAFSQDVVGALAAAGRAGWAAEQANKFAAIAENAAKGVEICHFGYRYSEAEKVVDLNEEGTVKMYLFPTGNGCDAVVTGAGAISNFTHYKPNSNGQLQTVGDVPQYIEKITRLHIESGITEIGDYFMCRAFDLRHLSFGDSKAVTRLGKYAFAYTQICGEYDFSGLQDATINNVFEACPKLEGLTFNGNVTTIAKKAFQFCLALRYVNGISNVTNIGEAALQYCTCLEHIDVVPANVTLGNWAFILTPNEAVIKGTDTALKDAVWKSTALMPFAQNEWEGTQIATPIENRPASVSLPIPETDNQKSDIYKGDWKPFLQPNPSSKEFARNRATGGCFFFSLFHVYNIMKPNAPYDTFYDFIMKGIAPKKIKITASVRSALTESEVWDVLMAWHATNTTGITYAEGTEVSVLDLPLCLDFYNRDYVQEGTFFWGMRQVLGWEATELLFNDDASRGQPIKETILDELANGRPVIMEIVGASSYDDPNGDGVFGDGEGHAMHAVTAIGYDREADKLLIVDSTWEYPSDIVPMVYWLPFEALITPDKASAVWTFDFGEVITMTDIDGKLEGVGESNARIEGMLKAINSGFRMESGEITLTADMYSGGKMKTQEYKFECTSGAKLIVFEADEDTYAKIVALTDKYYTIGATFVFADSVTGADDYSDGIERNGMMVVQAATNKLYFSSAIATNEDGCNMTIYSLLAGTYRWKAYYWDE